MAKRPDLDVYFKKITNELTGIADRALRGQDVKNDLAQWMARTDKIEHAWLQEGTNGQSVFDRTLQEPTPVSTTEGIRYGTIERVLAQKTESKAQQFRIMFSHDPVGMREARQRDPGLKMMDTFRDVVEQRMIGARPKEEEKVLRDAGEGMRVRY